MYGRIEYAVRWRSGNAAVCPSTILPNLRFGLDVRDPAFAKLTVRWRSGNAVVCKTTIQGFDSPPHLKPFAKQSAGQNSYARVQFPLAPHTGSVVSGEARSRFA